MKGSGQGQPETNYSLYVNARCARCGAAIFEDEGVRAADGRLLCKGCSSEEEAREAQVNPLQRSIPLPLPGGSLLEIILVALILGLLVSTAISPLVRVKKKATEDALQIKFFQSADLPLSTLALDVATAEGQELDGQIQQLAQMAGITQENMPAFKADVMKHQQYDSPEAKAGAILQVIEKWKSRLGSSLEQTLDNALPSK